MEIVTPRAWLYGCLAPVIFCIAMLFNSDAPPYLPPPSSQTKPSPSPTPPTPSTFNTLPGSGTLGPDCNTIANGDLSQTSVSANIDHPHVQYLGELLRRCANAYNGRNFIFTILNDNAEIRRYTPDTPTLQTN